MNMPITLFYAGILTIIVLFLATRAGFSRGKVGASIGDGGNVELHEKIRRHGNAIEFVPLALILFGLLEANGAGSTLLHSLGAALVVSRIAHPIGLKADNMAHPLRAIGAGGTALVMLIAAVYGIWMAAGTIF